jgi:hypothetical protein
MSLDICKLGRFFLVINCILVMRGTCQFKPPSDRDEAFHWMYIYTFLILDCFFYYIDRNSSECELISYVSGITIYITLPNKQMKRKYKISTSKSYYRFRSVVSLGLWFRPPLIYCCRFLASLNMNRVPEKDIYIYI